MIIAFLCSLPLRVLALQKPCNGLGTRILSVHSQGVCLVAKNGGHQDALGWALLHQCPVDQDALENALNHCSRHV